MGIFDLLSAPDKKIYRRDFEKILRHIPELSRVERLYIEGTFGDELNDGLSKFELQKKCQQLMYRPGDPIDAEEVEKIREKLSKYFD